MSAHASMTLPQVLEEFYKIYGKDGNTPRLFEAGGRFALIGEHIDYNGGFAIIASAVGKSCYIFARVNNSNRMRIAFTDIPTRADLDLSDLNQYKKEKFVNYEAGAAAVLAESGVKVVGVDLLYHITIPFGKGLSSSAAITVSTLYTLSVCSNAPIDILNIAKLSRKAENDYVGMNCGSMDQMATCFSRRNKFVVLNTDTLAYEYIDSTLLDYVVLLADTNKPRALVDSKYNERVAECKMALKILHESGGPTVKAAANLCSITPETLEAEGTAVLREKGGEAVLKRAQFCAKEQATVKKLVPALREGKLDEVGRLLNESHACLRDYYEVSCHELDVIASIASAFPGCLGCRMMGAGFGGSCVAIVHKDSVDALMAHLDKEYTLKTGLKCTMSVSAAADGVHEVLDFK